MKGKLLVYQSSLVDCGGLIDDNCVFNHLFNESAT